MPALAIRDDIAPEELRRRAQRERDGRVSARLISLAGRPPEGLVLDGREYGGKLNGSGRKTVPAPVSDFPLPVPYIPTDAGKRKLKGPSKSTKTVPSKSEIRLTCSTGAVPHGLFGSSGTAENLTQKPTSWPAV